MLTHHRFAIPLLALGLTLGLGGWTAAQAADPALPAATAAPSQSAPAKIDLSFPDGEKWSAATEREKMAYLLGIRDMASAEYQLTGPNPKRRTLVEKLVESLDGMTLRQIMEKVDAYYKTNPDRQKQTIFEVVWFQLVVPKTGPAKIK
ncbi:MAG: hypothetical protein LM523_06185 [Candidatus Contendobacter sp.]|nr:hypothetical protein [Candidatus Contendobacter sp.]